MNRLFVAYKPIGISSNFFLSKIKRKYGVKKAGYSGTLDPFACGVILVAFGEYTKFLRFLNTEPKEYIATIWIGTSSDSLDNQNIKIVEKTKPFHIDTIKMIINNLKGKLEFIPPKFCAKSVDGIRAYKLARMGLDFELKPEIMEVFNVEIVSYFHPFLTIKISVSKGGYIRSYAQLFAKKLGVNATLSYLCRLKEGDFCFNNEQEINLKDSLNLKSNTYKGNLDDIDLGKKLIKCHFTNQENGRYIVRTNEFYSIIEIGDCDIKYLLNRIKF